jgi:hypothetical protein
MLLTQHPTWAHATNDATTRHESQWIAIRLIVRH